MDDMKIRDLEKVFTMAKAQNIDVCVELTIPGKKAHEFILTLNDNLDYKLDYYKNNYNENLELTRCADVKIVNAFMFSFGKQNNQGFNL